MAGQTKQGSKEQQTPLLEWIAAGLGLLVLLGMFGFLIVEALAPGTKVPPLLRVEPVRVEAMAGQYLVIVKVANGSGQTGAGVHIDGTLNQGGAEIEKSNATIAYVPGMSERHAGLIFSRDPRLHDAQFRVTGYQRP